MGPARIIGLPLLDARQVYLRRHYQPSLVCGEAKCPGPTTLAIDLDETELLGGERLHAYSIRLRQRFGKGNR